MGLYAPFMTTTTGNPSREAPGSQPGRRELAKALRQHASTLKMMGVDFVPVAQGALPEAAQVVHEAPAAQTPAARAAPPRAPARSPSLARTPAAASTGASAGGSVPAPAPATSGASPASEVVLSELKPRVFTDALRVTAQRQLDELRARYERDAPHQHFVTDHHTIVFGEGDPRARLMFVGEAPGAEEDKVGRPFIGRAGQLLDKMIVAMGLRREDVYIANVLKTRPPNNATPTMDECARCAPYLYEQIAIVQPEVIVTLGLPATRVLLNTQQAMGQLRAHWASYPPEGWQAGGGGFARAPEKPIPVMPTYHPAFLLRAYTTDNRQKVWSDLQQVVTRLGLRGGAGGDGARAADGGVGQES